VNGFPLVCGGYSSGSVYQKACFALKSSSWSQVGEMDQARFDASSVVLPNGTIFIRGGQDGIGSYLRTTELMEIDSDGEISHQSPGPDMPTSSWGHCSVLTSTSNMILMGGFYGSQTHFLNLESGSWTAGPPLQDTGLRLWPACGHIVDKKTKTK